MKGEKALNEFDFFYILRIQDREAFLSEVGAAAKALRVEPDPKNGGKPKPGGGLYCSIDDWGNWKPAVMGLLIWAWFRKSWSRHLAKEDLQSIALPLSLEGREA